LRATIVACVSALLLAACQTAATAPRLPPEMLVAAAEAEGDPRYAAIVVDAATGTVLHADHADARRHPASLTKMMTLYLLFEALETGELRESTPLPVSAAAARQPPTRLGLAAGTSIRASDAVLAMAVRSANDVAVVVAEALASSEAAFVARMNAKARTLGLRATRFRNASGLPHPEQVTTARDIALLATALQRDFPARYRVFSARDFVYAGSRYRNTNDLLGEVPGVDGIKTGYIRASGYNLAASVLRGGHRYIVVAMGAPTIAARNAEVTALIAGYIPGSAVASR
jgi:D-alanyl-D-alanine carboxypeptidase